MWDLIKRTLLGKTADFCAECGAHVREGDGFRVLPMQVYCSEAHALAHQDTNPL